jgi:hypothetical protein
MWRMRAEPVVPVGLVWRWGRDSRFKLAKILEIERSILQRMDRTQSLDAEPATDNEQN